MIFQTSPNNSKIENNRITGWDDPRSYIKRTDIDGQIAYKGTLVLNGAEFRFSMTQQNYGKYLIRGRVSAISPEDGFVLQVVGAEKKRRLDKKMANLSNKETNSVPQGSIANAEAVKQIKRQKVLNVTTEVYGQSLDEETVKNDIERAVLRLYTQYADLIHRRLKTSSRPDSITPIVAAVLYVED